MVRVEFTIQRRHLIVLVGMLLSAMLLIPGIAWASNSFTDVDDDSVFKTDIQWLADVDVTKGCNPPTNDEFCPGSNVTREQMAAFMHRLAVNRVVDAKTAITADHATYATSAENADTIQGMTPTDLIELVPTTTDTAGQGLDHNNLQPGLVLNCIIAVTGIFPSDSLTPTSRFIGEIKWFAGGFAPGGYEFCDGQLLQISSNSALFAILGTTYGGDGTTTFALPDARGRVVVHEGSGSGLTTRNLGHSLGAETEALTVKQLAPHDHGITP